MEPNESIMQKLLDIQSTLKVEKGTYNKFGEFYYRSKEDILEAAKPMCHERGLTLICDDEVRCLDNGWVYVTTTVTLTDVLTGECVTAKASAREPNPSRRWTAPGVWQRGLLCGQACARQPLRP